MPQEDTIEVSPIDKILEPSEQVRSSIDEEELEALAHSIRLVGQLEPIKVKKEGKKYRIIDGHMRYLSLKMNGSQTIAAIIKAPTKEAEASLRVHSNIFRVAQDPLGEGEYYQQKMAEWRINSQELAKRLKLPPSRVKERLSLLNYPDDVKEAIRQKQITLAVARELSRLENELLRKDFLRRAIYDGVSASRMKIWVEKYINIPPTQPPPPKEEIEEEIKEMEEYYQTPCEICNKKVKVGTLTSLSGHFDCIQDVRLASLEYLKREAEERQKKNGDHKKEKNI